MSRCCHCSVGIHHLWGKQGKDNGWQCNHTWIEPLLLLLLSNPWGHQSYPNIGLDLLAIFSEPSTTCHGDIQSKVESDHHRRINQRASSSSSSPTPTKACMPIYSFVYSTAVIIKDESSVCCMMAWAHLSSLSSLYHPACSPPSDHAIVRVCETETGADIKWEWMILHAGRAITLSTLYLSIYLSIHLSKADLLWFGCDAFSMTVDLMKSESVHLMNQFILLEQSGSSLLVQALFLLATKVELAASTWVGEE